MIRFEHLNPSINERLQDPSIADSMFDYYCPCLNQLQETFSIPPGRYALGVSGGADSTALAILAGKLSDVSVILVHLNHQLRGKESDDDEQFVRNLAKQLHLPLIVGQRPVMEIACDNLPTNPSAKYRALRFELFKKVIQQHDLDGLLVAHHADDQAETILLRLARGGSIYSLTGMLHESRINNLRVIRPLLSFSSAKIRDYLRSIHQDWREDSSNQSTRYRRNVARSILKNNPALIQQLLRLSEAARTTLFQLDANAPLLEKTFPCIALSESPRIIARHAARRWLILQGTDPDDISPGICQRLVDQAMNPETPIRQHYPGRIWVRRRKKQIDVIPPENT